MSGTEETPGTSADPELPGEGDNDQLAREDTLESRAVDDLLDEGYSPPERDRNNHWGETAYEESRGESHDQQLAQERPEAWQERGATEYRQADRAGRIEDVRDGSREQDGWGRDAGIAGGAASAEEAAMHIVVGEDEDADGEPDPEGVVAYVRGDEDGLPDQDRPDREDEDDDEAGAGRRRP
jgi:hypothetical protein